MLRWRRQQDGIGLCRHRELAGRADTAVELDARQEDRVLGGDGLGLTRPQNDVTAGATQDLRQRGAPSAAADDAEDLHENWRLPRLTASDEARKALSDQACAASSC